MPGGVCVGVIVPLMLTDEPNVMEVEDGIEIVDKLRRNPVRVWGAFIVTTYIAIPPTFVPSRLQ
jgi:hypothetical protein